MDVEDEEEEERADDSQDISCDQDGLVETSANQGADRDGAEVEPSEEMGEASGNILEQTSGSDTLWSLRVFESAWFSWTLKSKQTKVKQNI